MKFIKFIIEKIEDKERPPVFKETDGISPFPEMTMNALEKEITSLAKDLDVDWKNASELLNSAFDELDVPVPQAHNKARWAQYIQLLSHTVKQLYKARGLKAGWTQTV